jgi:glycosyltransferase 2 family protein
VSRAQRNWLLRGVTLAAILLGGWLLYRTASQYTLADIIRSLRAMRWSNILLCLAFAAASYVCLTINDWLALRYIGRPLRYWQAALASFVSLALGHNIGFAGLSSGPIRYRFYSRWGLGAAEVAKLVLFCGVTIALGLLSVAAIILIAAPEMVAPTLHVGATFTRLIGLVLAGIVIGYLVLAFAGQKQISIRGWTLAVPPPHLALAQTILGTVDLACISACLKAALASGVAVSYIQAVVAFVVGNIAALLTHVPGGLGVIETAVTYLVPHQGNALGGGLVLFRLSYYLLPLALGLIVLFFAELAFRSGAAGRLSLGQRKGPAGSTNAVPNTGEIGPSSAIAKGTSRR